MKQVLILVAVAGTASAGPLSDVGPAASPWNGTKANVPSYGGGVDAPIYSNGPLVTHPGAGFGGANASAISPGGTIFGFGAQQAIPNRMADDFVIPTGESWKIDSVCFFVYQTGATTVSTITGADINLWSGAAPGGTLAGASSTILSNAWSGIYRVTATALTGSTRPIMQVEIDFGGLMLNAGQYWVDFAAAGSLASGPFAPPVSDPSVFPTGNAMQSLAGVWGPAMDTTNQVAMPFVVKGSIIPAPGALSLLALGGLVATRRRR